MTIADVQGSTAAAGPDPAAVLARAEQENFPVASRLLPRAQREALLAVYGFARMVDDIGDEAPPQDRPVLLDWAERELDAVYGGEPRHPLMRRLVPVVRAHAIPPEPFRALIEANRRDQEVTSYATWADLRDYCRLSADPVGRIVLHVFGRATPERIELSDRVCTGLQLVEHLQDVTEDLARGRVYLPEEDLARFGATPADLHLRPAPGPVRRAIALECERARGLLTGGLPLARTLPRRPAFAVAAFAAGGLAALDEIERVRFDVSAGVPAGPAGRRLRRLGWALLRSAIAR